MQSTDSLRDLLVHVTTTGRALPREAWQPHAGILLLPSPTHDTTGIEACAAGLAILPWVQSQPHAYTSAIMPIHPGFETQPATLMRLVFEDDPSGKRTRDHLISAIERFAPQRPADDTPIFVPLPALPNDAVFHPVPEAVAREAEAVNRARTGDYAGALSVIRNSALDPELIRALTQIPTPREPRFIGHDSFETWTQSIEETVLPALETIEA